MLFEKNEFEGVFIISPKTFEDERGYFFESYNKSNFIKHGIDVEFVQDNQSLSKKNVLRGLHYQKQPFGQGKLIRVLKGSVLDVAVDIRKSSKTFGKHFKIQLSEQNQKMVFLPEGFAHGFLSLEDNTVFSYKCTNFYHQESECSLLWNDATLNIDWGINNPVISQKDNIAPIFNATNFTF